MNKAKYLVVVLFLVAFAAISQVDEPLEYGWDMPVAGKVIQIEASTWQKVQNKVSMEWILRIPLPRVFKEHEKGKLHFKIKNASHDTGWKIIVEHGDNIVNSYDYDDIEDLKVGTWTDTYAGGGQVSISFYSKKEPSSIEILMDRYFVYSPPNKEESVISPSDFKNITNNVTKNVYDLSKGVVLIQFMDTHGLRYCSGYLIGSEHVLTNEHCVNSVKNCNTAKVFFDFLDGLLDNTSFEKCEKIEIKDHSLDYSIIRLENKYTEKVPSITYDTVGLKENNENFILVQHPGGSPKQYVKDCKVFFELVRGRKTVEKLDYKHECDTKGGSSGSPIFDNNMKMVALHHYGFKRTERVKKNRAVAIFKILEHLESNNIELYNELGIDSDESPQLR